MVLTLSRSASNLPPMNDLGHTLDAMDSTRLLLALVFVAGYAASIGGLASDSARRWSVAAAALAGLAFVGLTDPWEHGALLVTFVIVGIGAFIALAWGFSAWAMRTQAVPAFAAPALVEPMVEAPPLLGVRRVRRLRRRFSPL